MDFSRFTEDGAFMTDDSQAMLFPKGEMETLATPTPAAAPLERPATAPRLNKPERFQVEMRCESLDRRLDDDHVARLVWRLVEGLDLSSLYESIAAVEGNAGRNASDPRVLFALWLYAAVEGVGSARELERLCFEHRAYEWLRGSVPVNYHMLADFRVQHGDLLKQLQVDSLAGLLCEGLVSLECAAQDGMRVRASAASGSFRRRPSLEEAQLQARAHLDQLEREADDDGAGQTARRHKARERAARERVERVGQALEAVEHMAAQREKRKKGDGVKARASTTDPEARTMKMGDGGFRPAYNVQMATAAESGIILTMDVINEGSDAGQMKPLMDEIKEDQGQAPANLLTDGGFSTVDDIEATEQGGTTVYTPVKEEDKQKKAGKDPFAPKRNDSPIIAQWRQRMGTDAARDFYKRRAPTAELSNARLRNQGVYLLPVRGLAKVKAILWWHVLAVNLLRAVVLRAAKAEAAEKLRAEVA
jgi:transposase